MKSEHLDLIVLYAATSDRIHRTTLIRQLAQRLNVPELKLWRRLERLEVPKALPRYAGKDAIDLYEKRVRAILEASKLTAKLGLRLDEQVNAARARYGGSYSVKDVAKILRVKDIVVRAWIRDLWVLAIDEEGRVPKEELRRFLKSEDRWIAIASKRSAGQFIARRARAACRGKK